MQSALNINSSTKEFFSIPSYWGTSVLIALLSVVFLVSEASSLLIGSLTVCASFGFILFSAYSVFKIDALSDRVVEKTSLLIGSLLFASLFSLAVNNLGEFTFALSSLTGIAIYAMSLIASFIGLTLLEGCLSIALIVLLTRSMSMFHLSSEAVAAANIHQKYFGLFGVVK